MSRRNSAESNGLNDAVGGLDDDKVENKIANDTTQDMNSFEYNMNHKYRGLAIIFNHYKYKDPSIDLRDGTDNDVKALQKNLLLLGFEQDHIIVKHDLPKEEIFNYVNHMRASESDVLKNCDCIAVFILSHGSKGNRIYAHDIDYNLYDLVEKYTSKNLKELIVKPKLFFVSACRGARYDQGVNLSLERQKSNSAGDSTTMTVSQEQRESNIVGDKLVYSHPNHADILISLSSHHDHVSIRNHEEGTWYIQDLCEIIQQLFKAQNKFDTPDIHDILLYTHFKVSQRVASLDDIQINATKQIPNFNSALCRKLYFKPKPNQIS